MGHEAAITKKRVLGKVEQCLVATNESIATTEDLRTAHNAFSAKVLSHLDSLDACDKHLAGQVDTLKTRAAAAAAWCEQNEKAIKERPTVDVVAQSIAENNRAIEALYPTYEQVARTIARMTCEDRARLDALWSMTFWQRVRFVCFGTLPTVPDCPGLSEALSEHMGINL